MNTYAIARTPWRPVAYLPGADTPTLGEAGMLARCTSGVAVRGVCVT